MLPVCRVQGDGLDLCKQIGWSDLGKTDLGDLGFVAIDGNGFHGRRKSHGLLFVLSCSQKEDVNVRYVVEKSGVSKLF